MKETMLKAEDALYRWSDDYPMTWKLVVIYPIATTLGIATMEVLARIYMNLVG